MDQLIGRKVMRKEFSDSLNLGGAICLPAMENIGSAIRCCRCNSILRKNEVTVGEATDWYFCPNCIQLGRVDSKQVFYHRPEPPCSPRQVLFSWDGTLTAGQQAISDQLQQLAQHKQRGMIWAVTGAGKTEMLFETLLHSLMRGERICLASPRVDVCLELYPRIKAVFPQEEIMLLHGKAEQAYTYTKLVLCTTHQLLRFYRAFDVLIIDEVDAFPFVNEPLLQFAAENAVKEQAAVIYLTATPTPALLQQVRAGNLQLLMLPARYHRRELPVPKVKLCFRWRHLLAQGRLPKALEQCLDSLLKQNHVLLFCPSIAVLNRLFELIKAQHSEWTVASVHAQDNERLEKVMKMRAKDFQLLLTTTILERGVTFEQLSVIVFGAEHQVFTTAALVQIAGRVDRKTYTAGEVWFLADGQTRAIKKAIKQINEMNHLGTQRGLLDALCLLPERNQSTALD